MVGYTPSSFADLVFINERIEVGLKKGKFDHPALTNKKPRTNGENEDEGGTHAVTIVPTWPNFPPAQQYQYLVNIIPSHYQLDLRDSFPSAPSRLFIENERWRLHNSSPR